MQYILVRYTNRNGIEISVKKQNLASLSRKTRGIVVALTKTLQGISEIVGTSSSSVHFVQRLTKGFGATCIRLIDNGQSLIRKTRRYLRKRDIRNGSRSLNFKPVSNRQVRQRNRARATCT